MFLSPPLSLGYAWQNVPLFFFMEDSYPKLVLCTFDNSVDRYKAPKEMKVYHEIEPKGPLAEMTTDKLVERVLLRFDSVSSQNLGRVKKEQVYVANRSYIEEN